jgi:hypothetical protein
MNHFTLVFSGFHVNLIPRNTKSSPTDDQLISSSKELSSKSVNANFIIFNNLFIQISVKQKNQWMIQY